MVDVYYSKKGTPYIWASALRNELEIKTPLSQWFPRMIEYGFIENQDFSRHNKFVDSAGSIKKEAFDWAVQLDMAKHIAMIQRTEKGRAIREYLLHLDEKVSEGLLINQVQLSALFDIAKVMGFFSVQKFFETEHYNKFLDSEHTNWWETRARYFGYTSHDLQEIMKSLGLRYKSQRQALMKFDKYELIRTGIMDMFLAMGKSEKYAKNVGDFAKQIAKEIKPDVYNDINMAIDFKSEDQKLIITDIKSYKDNSALLNQFLTGKTQALNTKNIDDNEKKNNDNLIEKASFGQILGAVTKAGKPE